MIEEVLLTTMLFCAMNAAAQPPAKPNVVLLLTDDLGWRDVKYAERAMKAGSK